MGLTHKQIGEVAERTGLSLRTIRYYEEMGLVRPSARSHGGFRLYSESDIARLELVRRMKPLDFTLEEVRDVLQTLDALEQPDVDRTTHDELLARLDGYRVAADERCERLRAQLDTAEEFAAGLRGEIRQQRRGAEVRR